MLAPGARPRTWPQRCAPQRGSEYAASESPALTFTCSQKRPPPTVVSLLIPNRPPVAPRNAAVSRATKNQRSPRRLTLALGLTANRAGVTPTASAPKPVAPESSTRDSARARRHPNSSGITKITKPSRPMTAPRRPLAPTVFPSPKARASGARRDQAHRERALPDGARPLRCEHPTRPTAPNARPRATFTAWRGPTAGRAPAASCAAARRAARARGGRRAARVHGRPGGAALAPAQLPWAVR